MRQKHWYDYMWIVSATYLILGCFNILFAWLGLACFITPLVIALAGGGKAYCNRYCGRGQLFAVVGKKLSRKRPIPAFLRSRPFRYGFLIWFLTMFGLMLFGTVQVFLGAQNLREVVTLLWTFKLPWHWAARTAAPAWVLQFAFGFYSVMLTSSVLGFLTMFFFRPRSWCVYCPMGTMTQMISQIKAGSSGKDGGGASCVSCGGCKR